MAPQAGDQAGSANGPVLLGRDVSGGLRGNTKREQDLKQPEMRSSGLSNAGSGSLQLSEAGSENALSRGGTVLSRAGTAMQRAGSNLQFQRSNSLPTDQKELRQAATMPMTFDQDADRPCCCGIWKLQQMVGFLLGIALLLAFSIAQPIATYPDSNDMLGITALCACFWIFEVIPVYMTALIPLVLMPFFKVTSTDLAAQAYWSPISLLVLGIFLIDIAIEEVHLAQRFSLKLFLVLRVESPGAILACFAGMCWFFSMFCNSIAVTLIVTPFAISIANSAEEQVRDRAAAETEEVEAGEEGSGRAQGEMKCVQRFSAAMLLAIAYSATSGGIATISGALPHYFLAGTSMVSEKVTWGRWFFFAFPISLCCGLVAFGWLYLRYVHYGKFKGIKLELIQAEYEQLESEVGPVSRDEIIVAVLQVVQVALLVLRPHAISPYITSPLGATLVGDATVACAPALMLFFVPSSVRPGQPVLTWPAVHEKFDFGLLLLIGGSLAINFGFAQSGLNIAMGDLFASMVPKMHAFTLNLTMIVCITLVVQIFSGIGVAATLLPVIGSTALQAVVNPLYLLLPTTIATSFAFLLPTATPSNVVVLAKSQDLSRPLRFRDFFTNGLPITLVVVFVGALLTHVLGLAVFDSEGPLPQWACESVKGMCMWLPISGAVQQTTVQHQACIVMLDKHDGELCRLWNGTFVNTTQYAMYY